MVLGEVGPGEFLGEMGVIEGRERAATARAATDVRLELYEASEFLDRVSHDAGLALAMLQALSERLCAANARWAETEGRADRPPAARSAPASPRPKATERARLYGASDATRAVLPPGGLAIADLPFRVGRPTRSREKAPAVPVEVQVPDTSPFRLSRLHFSVVADREGLGVRDEGSHLGTTVNGAMIGQHAGRAVARLRPGENTIVAGGRDSPFVFRLVVPA